MVKRVLVLIALLLALVIPASAQAWTSGPSASAEYRLEYLIKSAHYRHCGRGHSLTRWWSLKPPARWRAKDMVVRNYFSHTILGTSRTVFPYLTSRYGITWSRAGEIIAWNTYPDAQSPDMAMRMWLASPSHRAVIYDCRYTHVGVGSYKSGSKHMYVALFVRR